MIFKKFNFKTSWNSSFGSPGVGSGIDTDSETDEQKRKRLQSRLELLKAEISPVGGEFPSPQQKSDYLAAQMDLQRFDSTYVPPAVPAVPDAFATPPRKTMADVRQSFTDPDYRQRRLNSDWTESINRGAQAGTGRAWVDSADVPKLNPSAGFDGSTPFTSTWQALGDVGALITNPSMDTISDPAQRNRIRGFIDDPIRASNELALGINRQAVEDDNRNIIKAPGDARLGRGLYGVAGMDTSAGYLGRAALGNLGTMMIASAIQQGNSDRLETAGRILESIGNANRIAKDLDKLEPNKTPEGAGLVTTVVDAGMNSVLNPYWWKTEMADQIGMQLPLWIATAAAVRAGKPMAAPLNPLAVRAGLLVESLATPLGAWLESKTPATVVSIGRYLGPKIAPTYESVATALISAMTETLLETAQKGSETLDESGSIDQARAEMGKNFYQGTVALMGTNLAEDLIVGKLIPFHVSRSINNAPTVKKRNSLLRQLTVRAVGETAELAFSILKEMTEEQLQEAIQMNAGGSLAGNLYQGVFNPDNNQRIRTAGVEGAKFALGFRAAGAVSGATNTLNALAGTFGPNSPQAIIQQGIPQTQGAAQASFASVVDLFNETLDARLEAARQNGLSPEEVATEKYNYQNVVIPEVLKRIGLDMTNAASIQRTLQGVENLDPKNIFKRIQLAGMFGEINNIRELLNTLHPQGTAGVQAIIEDRLGELARLSLPEKFQNPSDEFNAAAGEGRNINNVFDVARTLSNELHARVASRTYINLIKNALGSAPVSDDDQGSGIAKIVLQRLREGLTSEVGPISTLLREIVDAGLYRPDDKNQINAEIWKKIDVIVGNSSNGVVRGNQVGIDIFVIFNEAQRELGNDIVSGKLKISDFSKENIKKLVAEYFRDKLSQTIIHEIGHTLGIEDNNRSSSEAYDAILKKYLRLNPTEFIGNEGMAALDALASGLVQNQEFLDDAKEVYDAVRSRQFTISEPFGSNRLAISSESIQSRNLMGSQPAGVGGGERPVDTGTSSRVPDVGAGTDAAAPGMDASTNVGPSVPGRPIGPDAGTTDAGTTDAGTTDAGTTTTGPVQQSDANAGTGTRSSRAASTGPDAGTTDEQDDASGIRLSPEEETAAYRDLTASRQTIRSSVASMPTPSGTVIDGVDLRNLGGNRTDRFGRRTALSLADFILNIDAQSTGNSIGYEPDSVAAAVQEVIDKATAQGRMPTVQDFWNAETPGAPRPFDRTKSKYFQSTALTGIPHPDLYKFLLHLAEKGKGSGSWYLNVGQFLTDYVQKKLAKTVEAKGVSKKDLNSIVEELLGYFGRSGQETTPRTNMGWAFQFLELRLLLQDTASTATNPKTNAPYKNALDEVVQTNMAILAEQDRLQDVVDKSKGPVVVDEKTGKTAIKDFEWLSVLKNISKSPSSDIKTIINSIFTNQFSVPLKFVNDEGKPMLGHIYKYGNIVKINESLKGKSFAQALIDSKGITFADNEQLSLFIKNVNEIYQSVVNKKLLNERVFGTMKPSKLMKGLSQYAPNKTDIAAMGKSGSAPVEVALDFWTQGGVEIESNMKLAQYYGAIRESLFNAFTMFSVPDRWMFKSFGVIDPDKQSTASNAQASEFLMTIVADIASKLDGVTPTQLQAMIWTGLRMSLLDPSSTEIAMKDPYYVQSGNRQPKALWGSSGKGGTWDEKKGSVVIQDQNGDPWSIFSGSRSDANSAGEIADIFGAEDNTFFRKLTKLMDSTIRSIGSISGKKQSIALNPPRIAVTPLFPSDPQSRVDSLARRFPIRNAVDYIGSGPTGVVATGDARSRGQAGIEATSPTIIVPIGKVRLKIVTGTNQLEVLLQDSAISQTPLDKMGVPVQKGQKDVTNLQRTLTRFPFAQRSIEDSQKNYVPHYVVETADHYEVVLIGATPAYARIIASFLAAKAGVPTAQVWIPRATSNATSTDPYTMRRNKAETLAVTAPDDGVWTIKDAGALVSNVLQPGDQWTLGVGGTMILINPANTADLGSIADALVTVNNVPKESINVTNVDMMEPVAANPKASIRPYMQEGAPNFLQVFRNNTGLQSSRASDRPRAPLMGFPRARPLDPQGVAPEDYNEIIRNPDTGEASIWEENGKWYASTNDGDAREVDPYSSYERRRMRLPYVGERPYDPNASQATAPTLEDDEAKERMLDSIRRTRKYYEDQGLPIPEKLKAEMDSITSGEGEGQAIRSSRATTDPKRVSIGRLRKTVDPLGLAMDLSSANFMTLLESMSANGNQLDNLPFISWSLPAQFGSVFAEQTGIGMTKVLRNLSVPSVVGRQPTQAEVSNYIKELQERFLKEQLGAVPATGSMARNIYGALHQTDKLYYIPMLANFIGEHVVVMRRKGTWIEKVEDPNTKTKVPKVGIEDNVRIIFGRNVTEQDARAGAAFLGYVTVQDAMGLWRPLSAISIDQFDGLMDVLGKHVSVKRENNETHEAAQKRLLEIIRRNTQSSDPLADAFAMLDFETNPVHLLSINAAIKAALPGGVAPSGQGARTGSNLWHNIKPKNKDFSALLKYFKISNPNINVIGMKTGENPTEPETMKRFSQELADLGFEGIELDTSGRFVVIIDYNPFKINEDMTFGEVAKTLVINHIKYAEALKKIYEYGYAAPNDMFVGVWDGQLVAVTNAPLDGAWWADGKAGDPDKTFGTYIQAWGRRHPDGAKQLRGQIEGVIGRRRLAFLSSTVSRQPRVAGVIEDYGLADLQESIIQWTQKNVIPLEGSGIENFDPVRQRERGSELGGDTSRVLIRNSRATVRPDTDTLIGSISKQTPASMGGRAFPPSVRSATGEMISSDWGMLTPESPPMIQSSRAEITDDMRTKSKNEWAYTGDQWIRDFGQGIWGRVIRRANVSPEVFESGQDVAHAYRWGVGIENPESNALVAQKIANMSVYGAEDHLPNLSVRGAWEEAGTAAQAQRSAQQRMSFLAGIVADAEVALRGHGIEKFLERYIREQGKINEILYHIDSFYSSPPQQFVRKISPSNVMYTPEAFNFTDSDFQMAKNMIVYGVRMATQPDFQGSYGNTLPVARPFFSRPQFADDFVFIADILDKKLGKKVKLLTPEEMKSYDMFADLEDIQNEKGKLTIDTDVMQGNHGIAESYKMWNNLPESSPQKASDFWTLWDIYQKRSNIAESYTRRGMLRGMTGRGAIRSSLASAQSTGPNMLRHFANPDGTPLKGVVVDADGNVRATRLSDNVKMNELLNAGVYNGPAFPAVSAREGFQNYRDAIMLGLDPSIDKSKAVGDFIMVTGDSSSKMFEDAMFAATGRPVHVLSATNPHTGAQLVVQTDFAGSGNMSEHLPLPTYSKPFAQTYPDDATDNGPGVSRAVTGPTSGFYVLHDTGAGMSPVTIATTLMHAFASGKEKTGPNTGSSGGFGIGIGSVLSAAEHVEVMTTWRDPATGKLVRTTLTGSGAEFSDPTVGLRPLVMSSDVEGDGLPPHPDPHRELALQQIARAEANLHGGEAAAYVGLGSGNQRRYRWRGRTETGKVLNFNEADPDRATGWHPEYTRVNMTQGAHVGAFASWTESVASLVRGYAWVDGEQVPINAPNGSVMATVRSYYDETRKRFMAFGQDMSSWSQYQKLRSIDPYLQGMGPYTVDNVPARTRPAGLDDVLRGATALEGALLTYDKSMQQMAGNPYIIEDTRDPSRPKTMGVTRTMAEWAQIALQRDPSLMGRYMQGRPNSLEDPSYWGTGTTITIWPGHLVDISSVDRRDPAQSFQDPAVNKKIAQAIRIGYNLVFTNKDPFYKGVTFVTQRVGEQNQGHTFNLGEGRENRQQSIMGYQAYLDYTNPLLYQRDTLTPTTQVDVYTNETYQSWPDRSGHWLVSGLHAQQNPQWNATTLFPQLYPPNMLEEIITYDGRTGAETPTTLPADHLIGGVDSQNLSSYSRNAYRRFINGTSMVMLNPNRNWEKEAQGTMVSPAAGQGVSFTDMNGVQAGTFDVSYKDTNEKDSSTTLILSNGSYQYSETDGSNTAKERPDVIVVDVHSTASPSSPEYPFVLSRDQTKDWFARQPREWVTQNIDAAILQGHKQSVWDSLSSGFGINGFDNAATSIGDPLMLLDAGKTFDPSITQGLSQERWIIKFAQVLQEMNKEFSLTLQDLSAEYKVSETQDISRNTEYFNFIFAGFTMQKDLVAVNYNTRAVSPQNWYVNSFGVSTNVPRYVMVNPFVTMAQAVDRTSGSGAASITNRTMTLGLLTDFIAQARDAFAQAPAALSTKELIQYWKQEQAQADANFRAIRRQTGQTPIGHSSGGFLRKVREFGIQLQYALWHEVTHQGESGHGSGFGRALQQNLEAIRHIDTVEKQSDDLLETLLDNDAEILVQIAQFIIDNPDVLYKKDDPNVRMNLLIPGSTPQAVANANPQGVIDVEWRESSGDRPDSARGSTNDRGALDGQDNEYGREDSERGTSLRSSRGQMGSDFSADTGLYEGGNGGRNFERNGSGVSGDTTGIRSSRVGRFLQPYKTPPPTPIGPLPAVALSPLGQQLYDSNLLPIQGPEIDARIAAGKFGPDIKAGQVPPEWIATSALWGNTKSKPVKGELVKRGGERVGSFWYMNTLAAPAGAMVDIISNALNIPAMLLRETNAMMIERMAGVPREQRTASLEKLYGAVSSMWSSTMNASRDALDAFAQGMEPIRGEQPRGFTSGKKGMFLETVGRTRIAADIFVNNLTLQMAIHAIAHREAGKTEKFGTPAYKSLVLAHIQKMSEELANGTPEWVETWDEIEDAYFSQPKAQAPGSRYPYGPAYPRTASDPNARPIKQKGTSYEVRKQVSQSSEGLAGEALRQARENVFQERAPHLISLIADQRGVAKGVLQAMIPFYRTIATIGYRGAVNLTPMGLPGIAYDAATAAITDSGPSGRLNSRNPEEHFLVRQPKGREYLPMSQRLGYQMIGMTVAMMASAAFLAGMATGSGPDDEEEKKAMMAEGWRPWSFLTKDGKGKKTYTAIMNVLGPFSYPVVFGIAWSETHQKSGVLDPVAFGAFAASMWDFTFTQSGLKSYKEAFDALEGGRDMAKMKQAVSRYLSGFVPYVSLGRAINNAIDDTVRDPRSVVIHYTGNQNMDEWISYFTQTAQEGIPGMSSNLPPKRNEIGQIERRFPGQTGVRAFFPFQSTEDQGRSRGQYRYSRSTSKAEDVITTKAVSAVNQYERDLAAGIRSTRPTRDQIIRSQYDTSDYFQELRRKELERQRRQEVANTPAGFR